MYAIIETGGKQYKVSEGDVIKIEKIDAPSDSQYSFDKVLAVIGDDNTTFGSPYVKGATVSGTILANGKDKKVIIYKYKRKKGFHKKKGHRQPFTEIKIDAVSF